MIYQFDSETELIFSALDTNLDPDHKVYMVGGMVRDILMNRPVHDIDLSFCGNVREYAKRVADYLQASFFMLNQKYQTARIIYKSQTGQKRWIDIVATRENDILVDLTYRDFTVNAIAIDIQDRNNMIDPLNGALDLQRKLLQISRKDSLINDPVRILRAIRLAVQFDWKISTDTLTGMKSYASKLIDVSSERKRDEIFRMMDLQNSYKAIRLLLHLDLFGYSFPELNMERNPETNRQMDYSIATIKEFSLMQQLIVSNYPTEGAMNIQQGELVLSLGRFRESLDSYFQTNIHQDRSLKSLFVFCVLYLGDLQTSLNSPIGFNFHNWAPEKIDPLVEKAAKSLVLSSAEKKWMSGFFTGIAMIENLIQNETTLDPEISFLFFNRCKFSGVGACLFSLANCITQDEVNLKGSPWHKYLEISRFLLDSYFCHFEEWINPPTYINGHDVMKILKITDGKKIGWWINQLKIATIQGYIKNHKEAVNFLMTHKDNLK